MELRRPKYRHSDRSECFVGPIASMGSILKSQELRNLFARLVTPLGQAPQAVRMNDSMLPFLKDFNGIQVIEIRGICEYCDKEKQDPTWQVLRSCP